jgi:putative SOS response-associated peptidase YedK
MCGRYASFLPAEFIARLFATVNPLPNLAPTWNMAPTMDAPVVRPIDRERHLDALRWGLMPYFTKDLKKARKPINARAETEGDPGSLLRRAPEDVLRLWRVGKAFGNFRNDGPELLQASTVAEPTPL